MWIRIRIPNTDPEYGSNTDPEYGSGSGSTTPITSSYFPFNLNAQLWGVLTAYREGQPAGQHFVHEHTEAPPVSRVVVASPKHKNLIN